MRFIPFCNMSKNGKARHLLVKCELEADVLMVSKNREVYALLSDIYYYMCNKHKLSLCNPKAVFYPTNMNMYYGIVYEN